MAKTLKDVSLVQKNAVFETIISLYDCVNAMISEVENKVNSNKKSTYIIMLNNLVTTIDTASRIISTEYSDIVKKDKVSSASSNKIKKALGEIFNAVNDAKSLLA